MAPLPPQYANRSRWAEIPDRLRSWPIAVRRRRRRGAPSRGVGLVAQTGATEIPLVQRITPSSQHLGQGVRPRHEALVWRALLVASVLPNRAALARWRGVSRARITQAL